MSRNSERKSDINIFRTNYTQSKMQAYLSSSLPIALEVEK